MYMVVSRWLLISDAYDIETGFNFNNNIRNRRSTAKMSVRETRKQPVAASAPRAAARSARGEQARIRLKQAAARVLERVGYRQMRVIDVTTEAGVASGLFYHYFPDLKTLTMEVLQDFMRHFEEVDEIERGVAKGDWYARSHAHNRLVVQSYARNPGMMRCMVQMGDEEPEFGELWRASFHRRLELLVRAMPRLFPDAQFAAGQTQMVTTMLAGIGEQLLSEYYIARTSELRSMELDEEEIAEWITVMFYRALFLENPPLERLRYATKLTHMRRTPASVQVNEKISKQTTPDREDALS
jgi:AcrR family transcriptional regulator